MGGCFERGACGYGIEKRLVWVHLDSQFKISETTANLVHSCIENVDTLADDIETYFNDKKRTKLRIPGFRVSNGSLEKFEIGFDKDFSEKGIMVKKLDK